MREKLLITSVALKLKVGIVIYEELPYSHASLKMDLHNKRKEYGICKLVDPLIEEGFLLSNGDFVNRFEAMAMAKKAGQVSQNLNGCLFSYHF